MKHLPTVRAFFVAHALCLAIIFGGVPSLIRAQSGSKEITGRVQNAATGQYLNNARVAVKGTNLTAFTDETGAYHLPAVAGQSVELEVFYTGLDPKTVSVSLSTGQRVEQDISLTNARRYGAGGVVQLDHFVVTSGKVTDGEALAVNEQRFAANLKNVVSTDTFGDISEGNIAEFMKFMPGISIEYEGDAPTTVSVRGFDPNFTTVMVDGAQTANAVRVGDSREFHFKQVSINDTSRIEVTKVPTPATSASTMAGSINLVSKSAFERDQRQFNYSVFLAGNHRAVSLKPLPHSREEKVYKVVPNLNFDYTLPINKNLGIIITGLSSIQHAVNSYDTTNFNAAGAGTGASPSLPFLVAYSVVDFASFHNRYSLSLKVDWRPTRNSVLSVSGRTTYYQDFNGNNTLAFNTGTNAVPAPATGVRISYGDDFTIGATGRGAVNMTNNHSNIQGASVAGNLRYRWNSGPWRVEAGFDHSKSRTWRRYLEFGTFRGLTVNSLNPVRVSLLNFDSVRPNRIEVYDHNNNPVDYHDINNYRLTGATTNSSGDVRERIVSGDFSARRDLAFLAFPASIQVGGRQQVQTRDKRIQNVNWTYNPPAGNGSPAPYLSQVFAHYKDYDNVGRLPWTSPKLAYEAWEDNPALFTKTAAQQVTEEQFRLTNSEFIREKTEAYYFQADARVLENRLRILTGVRFEQTSDDGLGPLVEPSAVFARNPDGSFVRNAAGARVRRPDAGAAGSMQQLLLTTTERGARSDRTYHGYYPSLHFTYDATEQFLIRAAYAKTYGRPDFSSVIPNATINEFDDVDGDPSAIGGTINVRNSALLPWTADNYDVSLEYYTAQGGVFSAGAFVKEIKDFFGTVVKQATQADLDLLGLDSQYVGWTLTTMFNSGDARVTGGEVSARHSLQPLGTWGRPFTVFANATKLRLAGNQGANFTGFMPFGMNWGVNYSRSPFTIMLNWSHRGKQKLLSNPASGSDGYTYWKPRTTMDLSVTYRLTKRLSLFGAARNVFNVKPVFMRYSSATPEYARVNRTENYGVKFSVGIKGSF